MAQLTGYLETDKRGRLLYAISSTVPFAEKDKLIEQFVGLHADRKYWTVRMHMTKRSMPFTLKGTISFRANSSSVSKLVLDFDQTTIGKNVEEVNLIWSRMRPHMLRTSPAKQGNT